ncbi:MAG TPA: hypothetical protein VF491_09775 [Vicinamibacterales bacterium]
MKRVIAITAVVVAAFAHSASAQSTSTSTSPSTSIADVAKTEEARRKNVRKPAKVYTNGDLRTDVSRGVNASPATPTAPSSTPTTGDNKTPGIPATPSAPKGSGQEYWAGRMKAAQEQVARTQIFMDSLQSRINALTTDFVNRDDPAQRAKIETDRLAALAELERVKKELAEQTKAIKNIEEEARRAGAPPGWLRPGA